MEQKSIRSMFRQYRDIECNSAIILLAMDIRVDYEPAQYGNIKCLANPPINIDTSVTTLFLAECHFFVRLSNGL